MRLKTELFLLLWITVGCVAAVDSVTNEVEQSGNDDTANNSKIQAPEYKWFPRLNITCAKSRFRLAHNPACSQGILTQSQECLDEVSEKNGSARCVKSQRTIKCTKKQLEQDMSLYAGEPYDFHDCSTLQGIDCGTNWNFNCTPGFSGGKLFCTCPRIGPGGNLGSSNTGEDESNDIRTVAFSLAGTVMVGLLLFAVIRIRRTSLQRRNEPTYHGREVEGVDNEALGELPADSRLQTILNTINANGRNYELRERADSVPGRRVYVLSPTNSEPPPRGRGFSRATSQLSSIAEESLEDAMSHITEATEPVEDDSVFKYDCDTIGKMSMNQTSECSYEEDARTKLTSSSEAIDCINDVIAMYDVENDANNGIEGVMRENATIPSRDFRQSVEQSGDEFLTNFGWKPQERAWKIEKLKEGDSKSTERLYASCSTLDSRYSEKSGASSCRSLGNSDDVIVAADDVNSMTPLITNGDAVSSNLKTCKSLPSVLDTSQVPDIDEILADDPDHVTENHDADNGVAHA